MDKRTESAVAALDAAIERAQKARLLLVNPPLNDAGWPMFTPNGNTEPVPLPSGNLRFRRHGFAWNAQERKELHLAYLRATILDASVPERTLETLATKHQRSPGAIRSELNRIDRRVSIVHLQEFVDSIDYETDMD